MSRQAVILAGGLGTRLKTVLGDVPKALAEVGGKPVLGHQIDLCRTHGFEDIILLLGHGADQVKTYVGDGTRFGVKCQCIIEDKPLGTAGAVLAAGKMLRDNFLVMYCDTMLDIDLGRFWHYAQQKGAAATLLVHPNDHPFDSDLVVTTQDNRITGFSRWKGDNQPQRNLASAALYVVNKLAFEAIPRGNAILDFGRQVFPEMIQQGKALYAYRSIEYIKDLGTPDRLAKVNYDYAIGKVDPTKSNRPRPAVFLDRDGVINVEKDGIRRPEEMELIPGSAEAIKLLNKAGLAPIVVTNQPFISHGTLDEDTLDKIHAVMERDLAKGHAFVDDIYYCPHHPHGGYDGERADLKIECDCRKPKPGMILKAASELNVDLPKSWMIGDRTSDIEAGRRAGLRTILIKTGYGGQDGLYNAKPDFTFKDLLEACRFVAGFP